MRILWMSNSPFCNTGYGQQTATVCKYLKESGHDPAIFAFYGLQGSMIDWGPVPIFPNDKDDYGLAQCQRYYEHWEADLLISLVDVWVLKNLTPLPKWFPWTPIDHQPIPPAVREVLRKAPGLVKPIAMSRFGWEQMKADGIEAFYIPHSVDCETFIVSPERRAAARKAYEWENTFVIGCVGTNVRERKNWQASFMALQKFAKRHHNVVMYCHTDAFDERGRNLHSLRESLGVTDYTRFPSMKEMAVGISQDAMATMYNTLDVFLLPSKGEGFGIPIIEAQACGVPVIVSDNTAMTELSGPGWLLQDMRPEFTMQNSWEGAANPDEIVQCLEEAYLMWEAKRDSWQGMKDRARTFALDYDDAVVFKERWLPTLAEMERLVKGPRCMEGHPAEDWRQVLIPKECKPAKVLDIGCGVKQGWRPQLEHLGEYVGIDVREGPGVTIMDAHTLRFRSKEFGFAWSCEVLEHVEDPRRVVDEAKRVAKHGAILFCTPASHDFIHDPDHKEVTGVKYALNSAGEGMIIW